MGKGATRKEGIYQQDEKKLIVALKSTSARNVSSFQHHILSVFLRQIPHYLHKGSKLPLGDEEGGSVGTRPNCPEKRVLLPPVSSSRSHLIPFFGGSLNVSIYAQKQPPSFPSSFFLLLYCVSKESPRRSQMLSPPPPPRSKGRSVCKKKKRKLGWNFLVPIFVRKFRRTKKSSKEMLCAKRRQLALKSPNSALGVVPWRLPLLGIFLAPFVVFVFCLNSAFLQLLRRSLF